MKEDLEFLNLEEESFGKIFVDITYAIDNISPFLDSSQLSKRKYKNKVEVLKKYLELIQAAKTEKKKKSFFDLFSKDNSEELIKEYKKSNLTTLNQLKKCSSCACLNCTKDCNFDSCLGCRKDSNIVKCDKAKLNITKHDSFFLDLTNDRTGKPDKYKVKYILQDSQLDKRYISIESVSNDDKFILYFYPGISEDTYGEITSAEEFDFIVENLESLG